MRRRIGNVLWGIFFLLIGIGIAGNIFGAWEFFLFFHGWWTLFIIIPSFISIFSNGPRIGNMLGLTIGMLLLACVRGYMEWEVLWKLLVPLVFIIIGLGMVLRNIISVGGRRVTIPNGSKIEETVVFSSRRFVIEDVFYGMDADAIFGGVTVDLRQAKITQDVSMNLTAVFGGVDVLLPAGVRAVLSDTSLFGGCSNSRRNGDEGTAIVYINAMALFGGVEVK